jgi:hypothetical protein
MTLQTRRRTRLLGVRVQRAPRAAQPRQAAYACARCGMRKRRSARSAHRGDRLAKNGQRQRAHKLAWRSRRRKRSLLGRRHTLLRAARTANART